MHALLTRYALVHGPESVLKEIHSLSTVHRLLTFPMPHVTPVMGTVPAPSNIPRGITLSLAQILVPTVIPMQPLLNQLQVQLQLSQQTYHQMTVYSQRQIAGANHYKKGQLMQGGYKRH